MDYRNKMDDIVREIKEHKDTIKASEKRILVLETMLFSIGDMTEVVQTRAFARYKVRNKVYIESLNKVYDLAREKGNRFKEDYKHIWKIDLKELFEELGVADHYTPSMRILKEYGVVNRGDKLTKVCKVKGKSKRLHIVNILRFQDLMDHLS